MSRRRRTLSFVLIFLSENIVSSQFVSGNLGVTSEYVPNLRGPAPQLGNSFLNVPSYSGPSYSGTNDLLSAAQRLLANAPRPTLNDVIPQPLAPEPLPIPFDPLYQEIPIDVNPLPNFPISNSVPYNFPPPDFFPVDSLVIGPQVPVPPQFPTPPQFTTISAQLPSVYQPQFDYPITIDQNSYLNSLVPLGPVIPSNPIQQPLPDYFYDGFGQNVESPPVYQTPINMQIPSMPMTPPFVAVATPVPILPQKIPTKPFVPEFVPEFYPEPINTQITNVASIVEAPPVIIPSEFGPSIFESVPASNQPLPFSFQINMPPPPEQPIIMISAPPPVPIVQDYNTPSYPPITSSPPVIVMEKSRSSLKSLLPMLLIAMCDGGCRNNCGGNCCCGGANIPIPYPIPIPTNNPIILGRGKRKNKAASDSETDDDA